MSHNGCPTYKPELCNVITDYFADGSSITQVCARKLKIHRGTYYDWKDQFPDFKRAAEQGEQLSEAYHEDKLYATADGDLEGASASARIFIMKSRFRETYAEKTEKSLETTLIEKLLESK